MKFPTLLLAVVLLSCSSLSSYSQEMPAQPGEPTAGRRVTNRLPNNFGKLGLSNAQRERIYAVQAAYRAKINLLLQELEDLRSQESLEIQSVLTPEQQAELQQLYEQSQQQRVKKSAEK